MDPITLMLVLAAMSAAGSGISASGTMAGSKNMRKMLDQIEEQNQAYDREQRSHMGKYLGEMGGFNENTMRADESVRDTMRANETSLQDAATALGSQTGLDRAALSNMASRMAGDSRAAAMQRALGIQASKSAEAQANMGHRMRETQLKRAELMANMDALLARAGQKGSGRRMLGQLIGGLVPLAGQAAAMIGAPGSGGEKQQSGKAGSSADATNASTTAPS